MKNFRLFFIVLSSVVLFSCINEEGEGGKAVVEGYLHKVLHPDGEYNFETDTVVGGRADVYIMYGDKKPYGDKMDAGPDGYFRFEYLTKGTYTVFAYSKYPDGSEEAVSKTVTVDRKQTQTVDLYVHEGKMLGKSLIRGYLHAKYYKNGGLVKDATPVVGERVYIRKKGTDQFFNDVRTSLDGVFVFEKIPVGVYEIYGVSEDSSDRHTEIDPAGIVEIEVTEEGTEVSIPEPLVIRLRS